ncbi:MAG: hypothetical protein R3B60_00930 [Candidatus Paceibacterota bacterium]
MKFFFKTSEAVNQDSVFSRAKTLVPYIEDLKEIAKKNTYEADESSINLPFNDELLSVVKQMVAEKTNEKLRYIFIVGIGGSNLGTKAVYDALYETEDVLEQARPKMIFVDTTNTKVLRIYIDELIPTIKSTEEYLLVTISKSGGTTETIANTEILQNTFLQKFGDTSLNRLVVITDENSKYWQVSIEKKLTTLTLPEKVGGRYSVFSAVGMFPLAALGFDIESFQKGARDMREICLEIDFFKNPAVQSATILANAFESGKIINDNFIFNSELESLGKWYRQLLGESIGKEYDKDGKVVRAGLTPTVSIGSTDLHSVGQLYLGGPDDKITTFIYSIDKSNDVKIPENRTFSSVVEMINDSSVADIMSAILEGTKIAYNNKQLPFMEIQLETLNPYELGAFMQFKMVEVMYLGKLLNVNPFDQPNVESYKIETKKILQS